jgi:hypothetical protein
LAAPTTVISFCELCVRLTPVPSVVTAEELPCASVVQLCVRLAVVTVWLWKQLPIALSTTAYVKQNFCSIEIRPQAASNTDPL